MSRPTVSRLNALQKKTRVNLTTTPVTLSELRHGDRQEVRLNLATQNLLLPYATGKGGMYRLFVQTAQTAFTLKVAQTNNPATGAADVLYGQAIVTGGTPGTFAATANGTLTTNGTTQGGLKGSYIEVEDAAVGLWRVKANLLGSGVCVTPFS